MSLLRKLLSRSEDRGASAVEYGLLVAGIAALIIVAVYAIGAVTDGAFQETCDQLDSAANASASC